MMKNQHLMQHQNRQPAGESGIALFIVLWVLVLLSVIAGQFCFSMRNEVNMTRNFIDQTQARYLAEAGISRTILELLNPDSTLTGKDGATAEAEDETVLEAEGEIPFWRLNVETQEMAVGQGSFKVKVVDEGGKINLNTADSKLLQMMLKGFGLEEEDETVIVDAIQDWRDEDDLVRLNGAEEDYYQSLPSPYHCRNNKFSSVEELLFVRGITLDMFDDGLGTMVTVYSEGTALEGNEENEMWEQEEGFAHSGSSDYSDNAYQQAEGLVHSGGAMQEKEEDKENSSGDTKETSNKININSASRAMLMALTEMDEDAVDQIINYRETGDFTSVSDVQTLVGPDIYSKLQNYITTETSSIFTIEATGLVDDSQAMATIRAVVHLTDNNDKGFSIMMWKDGGSGL